MELHKPWIHYLLVFLKHSTCEHKCSTHVHVCTCTHIQCTCNHGIGYVYETVAYVLHMQLQLHGHVHVNTMDLENPWILLCKPRIHYLHVHVLAFQKTFNMYTNAHLHTHMYMYMYSRRQNKVSVPLALHGERSENGDITVEKTVSKTVVKRYLNGAKR